MLSRMRVLSALAGEAVVRQARASSPPPTRARLESVTAVEWVPLDDVEALDDALGREPESFHDDVIRKSVDDALLGIYRFALRFATDAWLVSRTPQIFTRTRALGRLESEIVKPGEARLRLTGWPGIRERHARQVAIGIERMLALTGRDGARVVHALTPDGAVLAATWRRDRESTPPA